MVKHRTWFKVLFNPLLRIFGWSIVSVVKEEQVIRYELRPYPKYCPIEKE